MKGSNPCVCVDVLTVTLPRLIIHTINTRNVYGFTTYKMTLNPYYVMNLKIKVVNNSKRKA